MKKSTLFLFRFLILFEICWGAHAWFTWWANSSNSITYLTLLVLAVTAWIYSNTFHVKLKTSRHVIAALVFYLFANLFSSHFTLQSAVRSLLAIYPIWVLVSDNPENAKGHLVFTTKILSFILLLGIIEYFIFSFYPLPGYIMQYGENENYVFLNYGFYLKKIGNYGSLIGASASAQRFASVFLEPGYLSAMLVFFIYAQNFDFSKRENRVLLYSVLLSLSLAGYVMLFIAFIFHTLINRLSFKRVFLFPLLTLLIYFVAINYNGGDNYLNSLIVERLVIDEDLVIAGNNRTTEITRDYFYQGLENGDSFWGLGVERVNQINGGRLSSFEGGSIAGTGVVYYFVVHGIFAALLFLLFYMMLARDSHTGRYSTFFVILIMICFVQASYPESASWIYPFILGLKKYRYDHQTQSAHRRNIVVINA